MRDVDVALPTSTEPVDVPLGRNGHEPSRRRIGNPYNWRESLTFLKNYFLPTARRTDLAAFLPSGTVLNPIEPRLTLAFAGDFMPLCGKQFQIGHRLREFIAGADALVMNFEGVLGGDRRVWNGLRHDPTSLEFLCNLFPAERTILTCANNHAADCGRAQFIEHYRALEDRGFHVVGTRQQPALVINGAVQISACSYWMNQPCDFVATPDTVSPDESGESLLRVLVPHWGYEFQRRPHPRQINTARDLLQTYDAVIGHHPHFPQPVVVHDGRLVAYSLGNLAFGESPRRWAEGLVLRVDVGPAADGRWRIGKVDWSFIERQWLSRERATIELAAGEAQL